MFSHEKLIVYQHSIAWLTTADEIIQNLPKGNYCIANQLHRASISIPLNIAEGAGKTSMRDKKRFYSIARGSTLECAAILDTIQILKLIDSLKIFNAKSKLYEIACILSKLSRK